MKRVRTKDTAPEMALRKLLFSSGLRYRVHYKPKTVPLGRANIDIAFPGRRLAVFVDGCFWHGCPDHGAIPKANRDWWAEKLQSNRARDERVTNALIAAGWEVLRLWTHQTPDAMAAIIMDRLHTETHH
ncbi:T/G mismatch-specific endonuclease [Azotobacter beijerinckii]|uniref:T/G mismatch-specific endonuclease n=1 Tax=Azotobacter beijerinckii TaxID=170623 RepID=A0A1H6Z9Q2_9GAMM|nr:very short patch repair endonuclease [Azotobacter beijerinckii]SEJ50211.1 T/G mismatch-specific endonuclease [Azotobacter beijerinckii]